MKKYKIEVTEEQLKIISDACELSSRLMSGQFHEFQEILNLVSELTGQKPSFEECETAINKLKKLVGLDRDESIGVRKSGKEANQLYEIYYLIKHHFAEGISIYKYDLLEVTKDPKIIIKEII